MGEIVCLGRQQLMGLDRDEHIGVGSYERGDDHHSQTNGYKLRQLSARVSTLALAEAFIRRIFFHVHQHVLGHPGCGT